MVDLKIKRKSQWRKEISVKNMLKAMTHHHGCHDRRWIEDDNCNEGRRIAIKPFLGYHEHNFPERFSISWWWKQAENSGGKSQTSDKTKPNPNEREESNWADSCGGVYLWSPPSVWFSCRCSPSRRKTEERVSLEQLELRLHSRTRGRECLSSPFTDLLRERRSL